LFAKLLEATKSTLENNTQTSANNSLTLHDIKSISRSEARTMYRDRSRSLGNSDDDYDYELLQHRPKHNNRISEYY